MKICLAQIQATKGYINCCAIRNIDRIIKGSLDSENEGLIMYDTETEEVIEKVL